MKITTTLLMFLALGIASCGDSNMNSAPVADADIEEPSLLELPLRIHILQSDAPELNAQLSDEDAIALLAVANERWSIADIAFELTDIRRPVVTDPDAYLAAAESGEKGPAALAALASVIPQDLLAPGWNVVVTQSMINLPPGVYLTAKLAVLVALDTPGGPLHGGTLAHELGHSLGLPHVDGSDSFNIMASGPGTASAPERNELNETQIATARAQAKTGVPASIAASTLRSLR